MSRNQLTVTNPIGNAGKERKAKTRGNKYWIEPVYREVIVNLDMMLGVRADSELIVQVREELSGKSDRSSYGFPFAGDNNFL